MAGVCGFGKFSARACRGLDKAKANLESRIHETRRASGGGTGAARAEKPFTADELRFYLREVEGKNVSNVPMTSQQRTMLFDAMRKGEYKKLLPEQKEAHTKPFQNSTFRDRLIEQWNIIQASLGLATKSLFTQNPEKLKEK